MNNQNRDCLCKKTSIGGQAVIEGVMMKGPLKTVLAVRNTFTKEITVEDVPSKPASQRNKFLRLPLVRGVVGFVDSLRTGYKTLMRSSELSGMLEIEEEEDKEKKLEKALKKAERKAKRNGQPIPDRETVQAQLEEKEKSKENSKGMEVFMNILMAISGVLGVCLAVVLFMVLPTLIFNGIKGISTDALENYRTLIEGGMKIVILIVYLLLVSQTQYIKRLFKYHGAEHKTIFCYEKGLPLTVENVRKQIRFHPRCGTSFMFLMIVVGIVFSLLVQQLFPWLTNSAAVWVIIKILMIPLFCGVGYELIKFCGRHDNLLTRIIAAPGLWMQRITTKEPDDDMIEVAIASMNPVIPENGEDQI